MLEYQYWVLGLKCHIIMGGRDKPISEIRVSKVLWNKRDRVVKQDNRRKGEKKGRREKRRRKEEKLKNSLHLR